MSALADKSERDVIATDLDTTLIVEAAAGTGKTTELVRRIIRIIETGRAEIGGIVAVTFTEKAAGELKLRLREALEEARVRRSAKTRDDRDARERLDKALARLEEAQVSTIHGFCADLLRERPVEARVDPLFTVLTDGQAQRLFDEAFRRWMEERLANPPEGVRRSLRRPTFSFGFGDDREDGPIDRLRNAAWELKEWRDFAGRWSRRPFRRDARIDALVTTLGDFVALVSDPSNPGDSLFYDGRPARQLWEDLRRAEDVSARDYDGLEASLVSLGRNRNFKNSRKGTGRQYKPGVLREDVWQAHQRLMGALAEFERDANADLAALLRDELDGCVDAYETAKTRAGALDFLDLLLKARNLIRGDEGVRKSFQQRFQRIFVDEFQDTDPLQAEILMLLAADDSSMSDWRGVSPVAGKLFIVGDPKQSIYRFRRADVGVYRDVYERLKAGGARQVTLQTSFRARPNIQRAINAAFEPVMDGDPAALQAHYVALQPARAENTGQPSVVVLPVPEPYGVRRVSNVKIEECLPDAVGAYVDWLVNHSGWMVAERPDRAASVSRARGFRPAEAEQLVPLQARHVCLLFRRFVSFNEDVTRDYVQALEARGIAHLLVGGRSFHNRAEIETLRAALAAIEWPDDELSVFAALRGSLFAVGDEELLEFRHRFGRLHPYRIPGELDAAAAIPSALALLRELHASRNRVPVAATVSRLLEATRAHVGFALEKGGEQVLANVSHVAELARRYEAEGGISFRGFLEELRAQAESGDAAEAPILEEGSDGVRLMTVHKAKGLEFPVVILADMTAKLNRSTASRYLDAGRGMCAVQLAGCSPWELLDHEQDELARDAAEGARLAYVAATRARDLLVIPAVGDEAREGWIQHLNDAILPHYSSRRQQVHAAGCPEFKTKDTVVERPNGDPAAVTTVCPGLHIVGSHEVVWWDPRALELKVEPSIGIRKPELIVKDVPAKIVEAGLKAYESWRAGRDGAAAAGAHTSISPMPAVRAAAIVPSGENAEPPPPIQVIQLPRADGRPTGRRFGSLVHSVLSSVPFDADAERVARLAHVHGRVLGSTDEEVSAAAIAVRAALAHPLLARARAAAADNRCRREVPIAWLTPAGTLIEGVVDLTFEERGESVIVEFKTDEEIGAELPRYQRQLGGYAAAMRAVGKRNVVPVLMRL